MERKKAGTVVNVFTVSVKNDWTGFKIGVKILEIKSAEINAAFN